MISSTIILASASPRRADLLSWAGLAYEVEPASIDESRRPGEAPVYYARRLAEEKALARSRPDYLSLGADTTVFVGNQIFEKPAGPAEAAEHLAFLSGKSHQVVTAFALAEDGRLVHSQPVISRVSFRRLSRETIERYVAGGEGLDKAGAYGLQGCGGFLVESIEGSFTNVVGLPLTELQMSLARFYPVFFANPSA